MFPSLLTTTQRWWLLALLALWAALLFGSFIFGAPSTDSSHRMALAPRLLSSLVLVIAAWSWAAFCRNTEVQRYGLLVALGMSFGLLGDLFLSGLIPLENRVLTGIAAFGIGHVLYISAFAGFGNRQGLDAPASRWAALALWLLIGLVAWYFMVFRGQQATVLHWAALPYALLLAATAGMATGLALQAPAFIPLAVGSALFLLSDLILAGSLFSNLSFPLIGDVIWLTYGPAQMLIVYSVGTALGWAAAHL